MWKEFKDFAMKGSLIDMAVGIILGISLGKVITSFVSDVLMPPIGLLLGGVDFSNMFISLKGSGYSSLAAAKAAGVPVISYGIFINTVIDFLIVAFVVFLILRSVNRFRTLPAAPKDCPFCFSKIPQAATRCPNCTSQLDK
ncbi:MAG TPA: large conductance mechanosensitive channel protein MscL [Armatimonadota bacterium]|jgi:large conductance mechanosensitive channel